MDFREDLCGQPLAGKKLVEMFSGNPATGGAEFSRGWEEAGGEAVRYDIAIDPLHDFLKDEVFWKRELENPADVYWWGVPCTNLTNARTTGPGAGTRTAAHSAGDTTVLEIRHVDTVARRVFDLIIKLVALGAAVVVENPMMTHLWDLDEFQYLMEQKGVTFFSRRPRRTRSPATRTHTRAMTDDEAASSSGR